MGKAVHMLEYDDDNDGAFYKCCKESKRQDFQQTGGVWVTKPLEESHWENESSWKISCPHKG